MIDLINSLALILCVVGVHWQARRLRCKDTEKSVWMWMWITDEEVTLTFQITTGLTSGEVCFCAVLKMLFYTWFIKLSQLETRAPFNPSKKIRVESVWQPFQPSDFAGQGTGGGSRAWNVLLRKQYLSLAGDEEDDWHWNSQPIRACIESPWARERE